MSDPIRRAYEDCFVYQCLTYTCHGANVYGEKFINVCRECPCFRDWLQKRKERGK